MNSADESPRARIRTADEAYEVGRAACRRRGDHPTLAQCDRIAAILRPYLAACSPSNTDEAA
jgi:hypothetical protein